MDKRYQVFISSTFVDLIDGNAVTLTPLARAVRIASSSSVVRRVRVRLLGSADAAMSGSSGSSTVSAATPDP